MRKPYHPKRTRLARHYVKDHKRRLARFNYSVKQKANTHDTSEWVILMALQVKYSIRNLSEYLYDLS